jgi:hypothetical protein
MAGWRTLAGVLIAAAVADTGRAQTHSLTEAPPAGKYFHVRLHMKLAGEMRFRQESKWSSLKQQATAEHDFLERVLDVGPGGLARKAARYYRTAKASISVGPNTAAKSVRPERRLLVAQRVGDQGLCYSPAGPLTREDLELTEHFDTLCLPGLLPGKKVAVGATWKVANPVVQALCNFEGLTSQDLVCKLEKVAGQVAHVSVSGKVAGIDTGAMVKMTIQAAYQFDLKAGRLTVLDWKQTDVRDQGPASPASTAEIAIRLERAAIPAAEELSDLALASVPDQLDPPLPLTQVYYLDKEKRFELLHSREWRTVGLTDKQLILRLMDRGDFVAQATITPWSKAAAGKHLAAKEFESAMAEIPGWEQDQVLQTGEVKTGEKGRWVYRVSALGKLDGLKVLQNFYLVASPAGEQVVVTFTMTEAQAQKVGARDLTLVGSLDFPASREKAQKRKKK